MPLADFADFAVILPEITLAIGLMVLLLVGVFRGNRHTHSLNVMAVMLLAVVLVLVWQNPTDTTSRAFNDLLIRDGFSDLAKILILLASAAVIMLAEGFAVREDMARFELPILILFATLGMMIMVGSNDMMTLYVGLELQSLALYVLAAFQRDRLRVTEAGLKYFVLGALSSGIMLFGISLIYGLTGTMEFSAIRASVAMSGAGVGEFGPSIAMTLVLAGMAFKISAVPFHMWTPDVYEGAPTPITAFFATAPKVAAMVLLIRLLVVPFGAVTEQWRLIILVLALASMSLGSIAALAQTNIKRLMAYSSIGHMGFALVGLVSANREGVSAVLAYLCIYLVMNIGCFSAILAMRRDGAMVEELKDLRGLAKYHPTRAAAIAVLMFSLAGIPPLAGFFAKFFVFQAAIEAGFAWLAVIGVLVSCIAAFYYLRIVKIMYFDEAEDLLTPPDDRMLPIGVSFGAISVILFLFVAQFLLLAVRDATNTIFPV